MTVKNTIFTSLTKAVFCAIFLLSFLNNSSASNVDWMPPPPDTFIISLVLECGDDSLQLCTNLNNLGGTVSGSFACSSPANGGLTVENDTCFYYHPVAGFEGDDTACIIICNNASLCDTFYFEIFVESCVQQYPCANISYDVLTIPVADCGDLAKICNPFPLGEALLYDYKINDQPYNGNLGICSFDTLYSYSYGSIPGGGMTGPYELQSWLVDGEVYSGTFQDVHELVDLMNMLDLNGNWILDTVTFNIISFNTAANYGQLTIVQSASNDIVVLSKNSTTAPIGSSIYLPAGAHQVTLQHQAYSFCVDTFTAVVYCNQAKTLYDTINVNETKTFCPDPLNLPGTQQAVEAFCNNCQSISYAKNGDCVQYTGKAVGTDMLLVTACDQYGICDSTLQVITVRDANQLPIARIDRDTTFENEALELDLLGNDEINGKLKNIFIIIPPQNGLVNISTEFRITYIPEKDFCGLDAFAYEICNENGCDTSTATILVRCQTPFVYNGFSPNNDGKNDTFTIFDIESFPQNSLKVYNRWGNLVFEKEGYQNEWDGRSVTDDILPDGTYFYLFEIKGQDAISGFVQISR